MTRPDGPLHGGQARHPALLLLARAARQWRAAARIAFGGLRVDDAIEEALLRVVERGAIAAAAAAEPQAASRRDQVREALARDLEAARYGADRAFRQYDAADPENRLVAAELEARWNRALARASEIEARIAAHDAAAPKSSAVAAIDAATLGANLRTV